MGGLVCDTRVDGNWRSGLQRSTEGTERSNAAGKLHRDIYRHGEWRNYKYGSNSVHGGVELQTLVTGLPELNGRDVEQMRVKRFAANEEADCAQFLAGSRVVNIV